MGIHYLPQIKTVDDDRSMRFQLIALASLFAFFLAYPIQFVNAQEKTDDFLLEEAVALPIPVAPLPPDPALSCSVLLDADYTFDSRRGCYLAPQEQLFSTVIGIEKLSSTPDIALSLTLNFKDATVSVNGASLEPSSQAFTYTLSLLDETTNLMLSWTPTSLKTLYEVSITGPSKIEVPSSCSFSVCADTALTTEPPTCDFRVTSTIPHQCSGEDEDVEIALSASESSTSMPGGLSYAFSTTCSNGEILDGTSPSEALLSISGARGEECSVTATVTDLLRQSSSCSVELDIPNCDSSDTCPGEVDVCGVCGGDGSSCITCETEDVTSIQMTSELHLRSAADLLRSMFSKIEERYKERKMLRSHLASMLERKVNRLNTREAAAIQVLWMPPSLISLCAGPQINTCSIEQYDETVVLFEAKIKWVRRLSRKNTRTFIKRRIRDWLIDRGLAPEKARRRGIRRAVKLRRAVREDLNKARDTFDELPRENFSCEGLSS